MAQDIPPEVRADRVLRPRLTGIHVSYIQDVCDFCLQYRYVRRNEIYYRLHGKQIMCKDCVPLSKHSHLKKKDLVIAIREEQWDGKNTGPQKKKRNK